MRIRWLAILRCLPLLVPPAAIATVWLAGGGEALSTDAVRQAHGLLRARVEADPLTAGLLLYLLHATAVACALPLASLLTPLAGSLFGMWGGTAIAVLAITTGASLFFGMMRLLLGTRLRTRIAGRLARLDAGFADNAFNYLLALRLLPIVPFWLVNLSAAAAGVRLRTLVAATMIGIVPGALIHAGIGSSVGDVLAEGAPLGFDVLLRPAFLLPLTGLALLALAPVAWRWRRVA